MQWKPNKLIAILLGFFLQPLGMLYINKPILAVLYLFAGLAAGIADLFTHKSLFLDYPYVSFKLMCMSICTLHVLHLLLFTKLVTFRAWYSRWYSLIAFMGLLLTAVFVLRSFAYEPFQIPSRAMSPTLNPGNTLVVSKWGYGNYGTYGLSLVKRELTKELHRGAIVVFQYPQDPNVNFVKRIIGLPGDTVEYKKDTLSINTNLLYRKYIGKNGANGMHREVLDDFEYNIYVTPSRPPVEGIVVVPENHIFVMGDNRDNSNDSRYWGFVPYDSIVGKLDFVF